MSATGLDLYLGVNLGWIERDEFDTASDRLLVRLVATTVTNPLAGTWTSDSNEAVQAALALDALDELEDAHLPRGHDLSTIALLGVVFGVTPRPLGERTCHHPGIILIDGAPRTPAGVVFFEPSCDCAYTVTVVAVTSNLVLEAFDINMDVPLLTAPGPWLFEDPAMQLRFEPSTLAGEAREMFELLYAEIWRDHHAFAMTYDALLIRRDRSHRAGTA